MRQRRLTQLIALSALSAVALYVVQGALATGADVKAFPAWFWVLDYVLWGARALIEAAVIVYLFTTTPTTRAQSVTLAVLEIALVGLITFTVGPALRAVGLGSAMVDSVTPAAFTAWSFGIAAYTSLMVGAAGYAFRVQGDDHDADDVTELRADNTRLAGVAARAAADADLARAEMDRVTASVEAWQLLSATDRARLIGMCANGNRPTVADTAAAINASPATVRRGFAKVGKGE